MAQQTATTAVGLELGSDDGFGGTIGSTASDDAARAEGVIALRGEESCAVDDRDDPFAYQADVRRTIAKATIQHSAAAGAKLRFAAHAITPAGRRDDRIRVQWRERRAVAKATKHDLATRWC